MDAYRVVEDYAWCTATLLPPHSDRRSLRYSLSLSPSLSLRVYIDWGVFFFMMELSLTFNRVFSIFPHPMYTLGYGTPRTSGVLSAAFLGIG